MVFMKSVLLANSAPPVLNPAISTEATAQAPLLQWTLVVLALLGALVAILVMKPGWGSWLFNLFPARRLGRWRRQLAAREIEGPPAELLCAIATRVGCRDIATLIQSRIAFEHTVLECASLFTDDNDRLLALDHLRQLLGWDGLSMTLSGQATLLEEDLEMELHGVGPSSEVAHRCLVIHCDERSVVFRLLDGDDEAPWKVGDEIEGVLWRENDAAYRFRSRVQETRWLGENFVFVETPRELDREQKRLHLRVPVDCDAVFLHIPGSRAREWLSGDSFSSPLLRGTLLDISAGGLRVRTRVPLASGDYVSFSNLPIIDAGEVLCRVVACRDHDEDGEPCCGLRFVGMPAALRESIAQKVFRAHRESLSLAGEPAEGAALSQSHRSTSSDQGN